MGGLHSLWIIFSHYPLVQRTSLVLVKYFDYNPYPHRGLISAYSSIFSILFFVVESKKDLRWLTSWRVSTLSFYWWGNYGGAFWGWNWWIRLNTKYIQKVWFLKFFEVSVGGPSHCMLANPQRTMRPSENYEAIRESICMRTSEMCSLSWPAQDVFFQPSPQGVLPDTHQGMKIFMFFCSSLWSYFGRLFWLKIYSLPFVSVPCKPHSLLLTDLS